MNPSPRSASVPVRPRTFLAAAAVAALLAAAGSADAQVRYVNVALTTGADDGSSWDNAYRTRDGVSRALAAAAAGEQIWVAAGRYTPTTTATRTISINLRSGIEVYGGFAGTETALDQRDIATNITILSGDLAGNDPIVTDNSLHVVNGGGANATAVLDGFTITGGNANGSSTGDQDRGGGLIFLNNSNATIRNCRITGNRVVFGGGGTYIRSASPTFVDCVWESNQGASFGGAIDMFTNCNPTFTRCAFIGNTAVRAGGVEVFGSCQPVFMSCIFRGNSAGSSGGGALFVAQNSIVNLRACTIVGNTSSGGGSAALTNTASTRLFSSIVYGNTVNGNLAGQLAGSTTIAQYSCVQGGFTGTGNISADPLFTDAAAGDLSLQPGSPCIDAGRNTDAGAGHTADFTGAPRFVDDPATPDTGVGTPPIIDMGAYEFQAAGGPACPADWNGDEQVNSSDISAFLTSWLGSVEGGDLLADFNGDGSVNSSDISAMLTAWLEAVVEGC